MEYKGPSVYDNDSFFWKYQRKRTLGNAPNENLEQPIFDQLIGQVDGLRVLDLGCGDGKYGLSLLKRGAKYYYGIDGSNNMMSLARENLKGQSVTLTKRLIEDFDFPHRSFDLIIARLVLHYIEDLNELFAKVSSALSNVGVFIFSVEHPLITSCYDDYNRGIKRGNWVVDHYFEEGKRENLWLGERVIKIHRTVDSYFSIAKRVGFEIDEIKESKPDPALFEDHDLYKRRLRIPLFFFMKLMNSRLQNIQVKSH